LTPRAECLGWRVRNLYRLSHWQWDVEILQLQPEMNIAEIGAGTGDLIFANIGGRGTEDLRGDI
jgi:hypothetical protein